MPETIVLDVVDGVATLTLNQPAKRNPLSARMGEEIAQALGALGAGDDARVLVLRGAGNPSARAATSGSSRRGSPTRPLPGSERCWPSTTATCR